MNVLLALIGLAILAGLWKTRNDLMGIADDLRAAFAAYSTKVDAYIAGASQHQQTVDEAVATALAADEAGDANALSDLKAAIEASAAKVPDVPVVPPVLVP